MGLRNEDLTTFSKDTLVNYIVAISYGRSAIDVIRELNKHERQFLLRRKKKLNSITDSSASFNEHIEKELAEINKQLAGIYG